MPTWTYICEQHGSLFRTKSGRDGHQRRLGCRPRKLRPAEQRKVLFMTRADLKDEGARDWISDLEGWDVTYTTEAERRRVATFTEAERRRGARG